MNIKKGIRTKRNTGKEKMEKKYADLLLRYCLEIRKGDRLFVHSTFLAEPLLREIYRLGTRLGALVEIDLDLEEQSRIFFEESGEELLQMVSPVQELRFSHYEKYLKILAPYNLSEDKSIDGDKLKLRREATKHINALYFQRTADGSMLMPISDQCFRTGCRNVPGGISTLCL